MAGYVGRSRDDQTRGAGACEKVLLFFPTPTILVKTNNQVCSFTYTFTFSLKIILQMRGEDHRGLRYGTIRRSIARFCRAGRDNWSWRGQFQLIEGSQYTLPAS
jgi:hypothetical protein